VAVAVDSTYCFWGQFQFGGLTWESGVAPSDVFYGVSAGDDALEAGHFVRSYRLFGLILSLHSKQAKLVERRRYFHFHCLIRRDYRAHPTRSAFRRELTCNLAGNLPH
jgi:hypothetical protein